MSGDGVSPSPSHYRQCPKVPYIHTDLLATLLITIVFDLKRNGTKGLVETIMASMLRVAIISLSLQKHA